MISAIIACGGKGSRANFNQNKLFKPVNGIPCFEKTLSVFCACDKIDEIAVVCAAEDEKAFSASAKKLGAKIKFVRGGATRFESVKNGVLAAKGDVVVIHDGARPFLTAKLLCDCAESAEIYGSGVACVPATDTIAKVSYDGDNRLITEAGRKNLYCVQTPQAFDKKLLLSAYERCGENYADFTDESGLFAKFVGRCRLVDGETTNKKLTYAEDFFPSPSLRAGTGFDLHKLVGNRKLILGGIEIPHTKGLLGHSDADVLLHAVMDALLSSAALGDIGKLFPDTDEKYKGISSVILYNEVMRLLRENGYKVVNISAVIMAQKPKLSPYRSIIAKNVAALSGVKESDVGITCTTLEGIGTIGREEGIAVQAYCLTEKENG